MSSTTQGYDTLSILLGRWYKSAITLTSSAMAHSLQGYFREHSFYLEIILLIPKTSGQRKMPQTYKMAKRDKDIQGEHSFLFFSQAFFLAGGNCLKHESPLSLRSWNPSAHSSHVTRAILLSWYKLFESQRTSDDSNRRFTSFTFLRKMPCFKSTLYTIHYMLLHKSIYTN